MAGKVLIYWIKIRLSMGNKSAAKNIFALIEKDTDSKFVLLFSGLLLIAISFILMKRKK
jgi:hypothetical protein